MLQGYISSLPFNGNMVSIGSYRGFELTGEKSLDFHQNRITIEGSAEHLIVLGSSGSGNLTRIDNMINGFDEKVSGGLNDLEMYKDEIESAKTELAKPFNHENKLIEMFSKQREINHKLGFDDIKVDEIEVEVENEQESENDLER